jgi:hypothetical protein
MPKFLRSIVDQFLREFMRRAVYGSVVGAAFVYLLITSAPWKAAGAAFAHADLAAAAFVGTVADSWTRERKSDVAVIAIDDRIYLERFQGRSPLDRDILASLLEDLLVNSAGGADSADGKTDETSAKGSGGPVIAIDFDVSPAVPPGKKHVSDRLDAVIAKYRDRLVLARPVATDEGTLAWLEQIQSTGCVRMGHSLVPQIFGLADFGHDAVGSLASMAAQAARGEPCQGVKASLSQVSTRVASDPMTLAAPRVLPAEPGMGKALKHLAPKVVMLGGRRRDRRHQPGEPGVHRARLRRAAAGLGQGHGPVDCPRGQARDGADHR